MLASRGIFASRALSRQLVVRPLAQQIVRAYSDTTRAQNPAWLAKKTPEPPMMQTIRSDYRTAKDNGDEINMAATEAILRRAVKGLSRRHNQDTDRELHPVLQNVKLLMRTAVEHYTIAERPDLVEKEQQKIKIVQSYIDTVPSLTHEEMMEIGRRGLAEYKEKGNVPKWGKVRSYIEAEGRKENKVMDPVLSWDAVKRVMVEAGHGTEGEPYAEDEH